MAMLTEKAFYNCSDGPPIIKEDLFRFDETVGKVLFLGF
jgi:hypothetical protein